MFSADEPSALVQEQGGPCAVIASAQVNMFSVSVLFSLISGSFIII